MAALNQQALHGWEIVDNTARLCVMNLYLHGIGHNSNRSPIRVDDALANKPAATYDMVLTNPPFGKKSSVTFITEEGEVKREAQKVVRDESLEDTENLPDPDVLAVEIVEDLESALEQFRLVADDLGQLEPGDELIPE